MKHDLLSVVDEQSGAVEWEFDLRKNLENTKAQLALPRMERNGQESDAELEGDIKDIEEDINTAVKTHETPINLSDCAMKQIVLVRFTADEQARWRSIIGSDANHPFILLGEIAQASGHVVISSIMSGKTHSSIHSEVLEVVPTQEC